MVINIAINSDCKGILHYTVRSMGKDTIVYLPRYKTRTSNYDAEELVKELKKDSFVEKIYLYKIIYDNGQISLLANPNNPIGKLECDEN